MSFFHPDEQNKEEFNYSYLDIQQIWLILKNGLCLGHWYFSGQSLESNLFAAFVSALFSFSKDMSSGGTSNIRNMSFSELDIYYLPGTDEKFFTAIAVNREVDSEKIMEYLEYIARKFEQTYEKYISDPSPLIPRNFKSFHKAILSYILINEHISTFKKPISSDFKFSLDSSINKSQYQQNFLTILGEDDIIRVFNTNPIALSNCHFVDSGKPINWLISEPTNKLLILSSQDDFLLTIDPLNAQDESKKEKISLPMEDAKWLIPESRNTEIIYIFSSNQYLTINITKRELITDQPVELDLLIKEIIYNDLLKLILIVSEDGKIYGVENIDSIHNLSPVPIMKEVQQIFKGPKDISYFYHQDKSVGLSNLTSNPLPLKGDFSNLNSVVVTPNDDAVILVSQDKLDIFNELGELLVSYPIQLGLTGMVEFNKREDQYYFVLVKKTGVVEFFKGLIERKRIREQQQAYSRKFDSILTKISRISTSAKKISELLNKDISSGEIQNQINLCKVYRQQLKNIIPTNLKNQETLPMIFQNKISKYENEVSEIFSQLDSLDKSLIEKFEEIRHKELQSVSSIDRIVDFIAKMRPRESIPVSDMAIGLELEYKDCLDTLIDLDNKKQLAGSLKEITKTSFIEKNYLFTKKDPELEKYSGKLSF